ncbi:M48 family peptidase [Mariniphaga sediminis]|uniref:M48 family peptidase n=1 Tax=Mariniphaga sediminis TaxID=1628158 RepID=A0A399D1R0_9BACT|nr:SprT family zinc-dependent metalloprotease [Mariniphaga sediminis]RIH65589.1 M48 family peptidase [Mariniphaga sediminis]
MPNKVVHFKSIGPVTFSRNRRSKNIKISVKPDKSVLVSFPFFISEDEVLAFLTRNEDWISRQQKKADAGRTPYDTGSTIKTKLHTLEMHHGETGKVETDGKMIKIFAADFNTEEARFLLEDILTQIYRFEARKLLPARLQELAREHGFRYGKVSIRNNKRNWGSCSSRNNISLNLHMMKLPDELIDYILLHELVHTEIKNHGPLFWEKLDKHTNYRARELSGQVKKYSTYIL